MADLLVELFGGLRVRSAGGREIGIASRKARALLCCLAIRPGTALSRDSLASLLWENSDPELARASLRQALTALRRALPEGCAGFLCADSTNVWLDGDAIASDVAEFHSLVRDGSPGAMFAAIDRCAGELFAGVTARSPAFEQWAEEQRRLFRRQRVEVLERVAMQCSAADDLPGQLAALERLVTADPVNERAHRELMRVLSRLGRHTDALRQYRTCRDALRRDLDVATDPATDALHAEILRRRRAIQVPVTNEEGDVTAHPAIPDAVQAIAPTLREVVVLCVRVSAGASQMVADPELERQRQVFLEAQVRAVAERFGGNVDRASQGEVLAVFGLDTLTGNEADRAARTGWELASTSLQARPGELVFACGIADGQVLPAAGDSRFPLSGQPVGVARELARAATCGSVYVSTRVASRLPAAFNFDRVEEWGPSDAQQIVSVTGRSSPDRPRRFVGRRAEMALLTTLLDEVVGSRRGRTIVIRGEPGIGKSALVDSLSAAARRQGITTHTLQVLDFGQSARERPIPALALRLLGAEPDADATVRGAAADRAVEGGLVPVASELILRDLVGSVLDQEASSRLAAMENDLRERARAQVLQRLMKEAAEQPLLLVIEDAQWAEPPEVVQLVNLAATIASLPVLVVLTARSDDGSLDATWRARGWGCPMTVLDLAPLAEDEARELAAAHADLPAEVVERCITTAAGHPLFLDQLLRAAKAGEVSLPGSVRGLVIARIERLAPGLQRALHAAAVLGTRFARGALRHLLDDPRFELQPLERAGLAVIEGGDCRFAHALMRDAVYESLLGSKRRALHRRAAAWYESRDSGLYAEHLAAAADAGAAAAFLRAAGESQRAYRLERALVYAQRAIETAREPGESGEAHAVLGDVTLALGRTSEACAAFRASIELAPDGGTRARAWLGLAAALRIFDRYDEALAALDHAERELPDDDARRLAHLWTSRGNLHFPRGDLASCLAAHERALQFAMQAGSLEDIARARGGLGDAQYQRGRIRSAYSEFAHCVDLCEKQGLTGLQLAYLPMVAATQAYTGHFSAALDTCARAGDLARRVGDRRAELLAHSIRSSTELNRANYLAAREESDSSTALARELGARRFEAEGLILNGLAWLGLSERARARETLERAVSLARTTCPTYCGPWAVAALALTTDDAAQARALLEEGERVLQLGCVSHNYLEFYGHAVEVALRTGDPDQALVYAAALETYTRHEPLPWSDVIIARARALAAASTASSNVTELLRATLQDVEAMQFHALAPALRSAIDEHRPGARRGSSGPVRLD